MNLESCCAYWSQFFPLPAIWGHSSGLGLKDGDTLGAGVVGDTLGTADGNADGWRVGNFEGLSVGTPVGQNDGDLVGPKLGRLVGCHVGDRATV